MILKSLYLSFLVALSGVILAADAPPTIPSGEVIKIHGTVLFDKKEVKLGDKIDKIGLIETKDKSFIQMKIDKWKNNISIGPNSSMQLNFSDEKKYTLEAGSCRWKSFAKSDAKGKIFTRNASMGVRGTDFLLTHNEALKETEVVMFDGEVHLENIADKENSIDIKKGQWGGIGGRFGNKINPPLDLPIEVLNKFESHLE